MAVRKCKLRGLILLFLIASGVCSYANGSGDSVKRENASIAEDMPFQKNTEFIERIKTCVGMEDIRIIQSKKIKLVQKWSMVEQKDEHRVTVMRLDKKTGVCVAILLPKSEGCEEVSAILNKVQNYLASEDIRIIQTRDFDNILSKWMSIEIKKENRYVVMKLDAETGIYTATLIPKAKREE